MSKAKKLAEQIAEKVWPDSVKPRLASSSQVWLTDRHIDAIDNARATMKLRAGELRQLSKAEPFGSKRACAYADFAAIEQETADILEEILAAASPTTEKQDHE